MAIREKNGKRRTLKILLLLTVLMIWGHSMLPAEQSGAESGWALALLQGLLDALGIPLTLSEYLVRKAAHFSEYALLGLELGLLLLPGFFETHAAADRLRALAGPPALSALTAFADETIQLFTPGRDGKIQDMWIDTAGSLCGTLAALAVLALLRRQAGKKRGGVS